ncbi:MAG: flagellar hook-length control protein FliK [Acetobacteraceae bacterium]|nr:flagellar hook-length control protein FliK [Acetobacteraceae bacterium]
MVQRVTGTGVDGIAFSKGSRPGASTSSIGDTGATAVDQAPVTAADALGVGSPSGGLEVSNLLAVDPASAGLFGAVAGSIVHRTERETVPSDGHEGHGTQAVDLQTVAIETTGAQAPSASVADAPRSLPADGGSTPSVASQVAPALVAMAQGGNVGGRLSISITPDQLGQVHITVERAADGTTSIHVAAEQLATLDMLRHDQSDLTHALNQAGVGQDGHNLSFSWNGGGGGMQGWDGWGNQPGEHQPAEVSGSYAAESTPAPVAAAAAARGGIDVTA